MLIGSNELRILARDMRQFCDRKANLVKFNVRTQCQGMTYILGQKGLPLFQGVYR
jgi:hypothetical protein